MNWSYYTINTARIFIFTYFGFTEITQPNPDLEEITEIRNKEYIKHIQELNPVSYISASIVFEDDISLDELVELKLKYNKINFRWLGVRTEAKDKAAEYLLGFNPNTNDGFVSSDRADKNKYPYLQLIDYMTDRNNQPKDEKSMANAYAKHFTSLLKYMSDRRKAVAALDYSELKSEYYQKALSYVESNGVNIYGVLVHAEARDLLDFINSEKIKTIEINGVLPSKYINY